VVVLQIEHIDAVRDLDRILSVPGVTSIVIGPNDLSGSMGRMAQPGHPEVRSAIESAIDSARRAGMPVGIAVGEDPEALAGWIDRGASWVSMGNDASLLLATASRVAGQLRARPRVRLEASR
jgi:2-keto-3-deoxy-L-rhamnonate aldolase RhmA